MALTKRQRISFLCHMATYGYTEENERAQKDQKINRGKQRQRRTDRGTDSRKAVYGCRGKKVRQTERRGRVVLQDRK